MSATPDILIFLGRLHPVLVHLPIAFILLVGLFELPARRPRLKHLRASSGFVLALASVSSLLSVVCGLVLSASGGYDARLLNLHKWTGIATTLLCLGSALLHRLQLRRLYHWCLAASILLLLVAGHLGGSLTHGSDYLVEHAPGFLKTMVSRRSTSGPSVTTLDPRKSSVFAAAIQPILARNCVPCHGPEKAKGSLRLDSYDHLVTGGESGPAVAPGNKEQSLLLTRVMLPLEHDDHMPPDGKPQPEPDDLALLEWWIAAGASETAKVSDLRLTPAIQRILQTRYGTVPTESAPGPMPLSEALPTARQLGVELGIAIQPLAANEPWLQCNASIAGTNFTDRQLARLTPIGSNILWLDLAGTGISDSGLSALASMPNLTRLHLEKTAISGAALEVVASLADLQYLNLHSTSLGDGDLEKLKTAPKLRQLYVWNTRVTPAALNSLIQARTDTNQIQSWEAEISRLQQQIREARFTAELGVDTTAVSSTNVVPSVSNSISAAN